MKFGYSVFVRCVESVTGFLLEEDYDEEEDEDKVKRFLLC
jgi:hypothetical protein